MGSRGAGEKAATLADKISSNATSASIKRCGGEVSNSTSTLSSIVGMTTASVAPVAVEFIDSKGNEGRVANLLVTPLVSIKANQNKLIKIFPRHQSAPEMPRDCAVHDMVEVIMVSITEDTAAVEFPASVVRGPTMQARFDHASGDPREDHAS